MDFEKNNNEQDNKINNSEPINVDYTMINSDMNINKKKRKTSPKVKKALLYILAGVLCITFGVVSTFGAVLYLLPNTSFFKSTPLYQAISSGIKTTSFTTSSTSSSSSSSNSSTVATEGGTLSVTDIVKKAAPAVVGVSTKSVGSNYYSGQTQEGIGSGMIINTDGDVLTNYHVVEGATQVKIILYSGKEVSAKVSAYDANYDIALVKITDKVDIPGVVTLGTSSSLQVGETVVAFGNPLGKELLGTVTSGIVSALNRKISGTADIGYIQTDTAINAGNSGGPLVNSKGEVIGINTAKINATGVEGLGFSIPIDLVKEKIPNLTSAPIMLGIVSQDYDEQTFDYYNLAKGVYVKQVSDYSVAQKAGIQSGDVITKFDGQDVTTTSKINELKLKHKAGDTIKVVINRDGTTKELTITLE